MKLTLKMKITLALSALFLVGSIVLLVAMPKVNENPKESIDVANVSANGESMSADEIDTSDATGTTDQPSMVESTTQVASTDASESVSENTATPTSANEVASVGGAAAPTQESGTPLANHGELAVSGTHMVDKNGNAYQLRGVSTHGINWFPEYVNSDCFKTLRDEWGANCIRLAMYTAENNGYCSGGSKDSLKQLVKDGVSYATDLGMYVIIDWHILSDNNPNTNKDAAIAFFDEMSKTYADYDNVIYEICNEPNGGTTWAQIKSYAMEVIPVIKANNPNAIIVVGTPTWSQDADLAAADPITGFTNIMYTVHFYADTHKDSIRQKMTTAVNAGLAIFCTEFGTCSASGNGANNFEEANKWIALMDSYGISYCIWNLSNKNESSSLIQSSCNLTSGWSTDNLSEEGKWYVGVLNNGVTPGSVVTGSSTPQTPATSQSGGNTSTPASSSASTVTASKDNTQVTIASSGSWESGSGQCYQYTVTVKNTGSSTISNWNLTVSFGNSVTLDQSWNGTYAVSGSSITITPVDFNKTIAAGQSIEVGFIVKCSGSAGTPTVTVN